VRFYNDRKRIWIEIVMFNVETIEVIQSKYESFLPYLNKRTRRVWVGMEAKALGHGRLSETFPNIPKDILAKKRRLCNPVVIWF